MSEPIKLHGFNGLERNLAAGLGAPKAAARFLDKWALSTERGTKANIKRGIGGWLWRGETRRAATHERDRSPFPLWARVGWVTADSAVSTKARIGEFGTNRFAEDESTRNLPFPTAAALEPWAKSHHLNAFAVAKSITRRGGIQPRRYLRTAAKASERNIPRWLAEMASDIERFAAEAGRMAAD